jgi:hypothetical protein
MQQHEVNLKCTLTNAESQRLHTAYDILENSDLLDKKWLVLGKIVVGCGLGV